jgi:hypothetical protein
MVEYFKIGELEELERVKKASAAVVRRARDDKEYAHKILEEIGYFRMMSSEPAASQASRVKRKSVKNKR